MVVVKIWDDEEIRVNPVNFPLDFLSGNTGRVACDLRNHVDEKVRIN
jgi:hypothetical protein